MAQYLADDDDWLLQHKHPIGGFIARINSYEAAPPTPFVRPPGSATAPSATLTSGGTTMPATTATGRGGVGIARRRDEHPGPTPER